MGVGCKFDLSKVDFRLQFFDLFVFILFVFQEIDVFYIFYKIM